MVDDIIRVMAKARFIANQQEKDNIQQTIIQLSSEVEALKVQAESSRLHIETLITQNAELSSMVRSLITDKQNLANEIQEVKVKNLETSEKFEKFVNALYKPAKHHAENKKNLMIMRGGRDHIPITFNTVNLTTDSLYAIITDSVKAAGMEVISPTEPVKRRKGL